MSSRRPTPQTARRRYLAATGVTLALVSSLVGCGSSDDKAGDVSLKVLAASSLTDVLDAAAPVYERSHPGVHLDFSYAGSQELAAQVREDAPADALITADTKTMDGLGSRTGPSSVVARNRLVIVTREGNPEHVKTLRDLTAKDLDVVLAAPEVPVGRYSRTVLGRQHLAVTPVSEEPNVRAVLSKVRLGEADAGIVYKTDAATAPDQVDAVEIPDAQNAVAAYPAATLKASEHSAEASDFVKWLGTTEARALLRKSGFQKP